MRDSVDDIIDAWAARDPDLDASPLEVVGRILLCARHLERALTEVLAEIGLTFGDFDVLNTLRRRGDRHGTNPRLLSRSSLITAGAMTTRLDRLAAAGLVERRADPNDRRGTLVRLTPLGRRRARAALAAVLACDERFLEPLGRRDRRATAGLLRMVLADAETKSAGAAER